MKLSIGLRLTIWYLAIFAFAQILFGAGMWLILNKTLYVETDKALNSRVEDVRHFLEAQKKKNFTVPKLQEEVSEEYSIEHSGDYLQIIDAEGNWIYRSPFLQAHALAAIQPGETKAAVCENQWLGGGHFRFLKQSITVNGFSFTVQTGASIENVLSILARFRKALLMFAPLLLLSASGVGYWLSRRALSPVDALTQTVRTITGSNLSLRLKTLRTGDELQRLSDTLNDMLARLEAAFLRVTEFTADASHELRTPLSLMRTEAELALRRTRSESEYEDALRRILLEAERTSALIDQLLALARADSGREVLNPHAFNLSRTMVGVSATWRRVAAVRDLQFSDDIADRELLVKGDETALRRVVDILLDNAFKYTPSPGKIHLSVEQSGNNAVISVGDTGNGIASEDQTKIFERFYRVDKARSRASGGSGLGLAIAKWVVGQHSGSIGVASNLGQGSTFRVELPLR